MQVIAVLIGGGLGALARFGVVSLSDRILGISFPFGTLAVNVLGSLCIGILWGLSTQWQITPVIRSFLFIGFLGSFTTFSSFSLETMSMIQKGTYLAAGGYILAQNVLSLSAAFLGYVLTLRMH